MMTEKLDSADPVRRNRLGSLSMLPPGELEKEIYKRAFLQALDSEELITEQDCELVEATLRKKLDVEHKTKKCVLPEEKDLISTEILVKTVPTFPPAVRKFFYECYCTPLAVDGPPSRDINYIVNLMRWYERKCSHRHELAIYCQNKESVTRADFEKLVRENYIKIMPRLDTENLRGYYEIVATVGAFFPLDIHKRNKIGFMDLLRSDVFNRLDEAVARLDEKFDKKMKSEWFSVQNTFDLLEEYKYLMSEHGLIIRKDMREVYDGRFNPWFIDGIYITQRAWKVDGELALDLEDFIRFCRAVRYSSTLCPKTSGSKRTTDYIKKEIPSMKYIFTCLDQEQKGFLDHAAMTNVINGLIDLIRRRGHTFDESEPDPVANTCDIIFDQLHPADPSKITLNDLLKSPLGPQALLTMIDAEFYLEVELGGE